MDKTENKKSNISKILYPKQTIWKEIGIKVIRIENIDRFNF